MGQYGVGSYVPGRGYVPFKDPVKRKVPPAPEPASEPNKVRAGTGNPIQDILTKVFGTVPRNRLKEAGLDDE